MSSRGKWILLAVVLAGATPAVWLGARIDSSATTRTGAVDPGRTGAADRPVPGAPPGARDSGTERLRTAETTPAGARAGARTVAATVKAPLIRLEPSTGDPCTLALAAIELDIEELDAAGAVVRTSHSSLSWEALFDESSREGHFTQFALPEAASARVLVVVLCGEHVWDDEKTASFEDDGVARVHLLPRTAIGHEIRRLAEENRRWRVEAGTVLCAITPYSVYRLRGWEAPARSLSWDAGGPYTIDWTPCTFGEVVFIDIEQREVGGSSDPAPGLSAVCLNVPNTGHWVFPEDELLPLVPGWATVVRVRSPFGRDDRCEESTIVDVE